MNADNVNVSVSRRWRMVIRHG